MCQKRDSRKILLNLTKLKQGERERWARVDNCLANLIYLLNNRGVKTLASCCGHGKYNLSIIYESPNGKVWDLVSAVEIPRKRRFYKKDKEGFYYIPEVVERR